MCSCKSFCIQCIPQYRIMLLLGLYVRNIGYDKLNFKEMLSQFEDAGLERRYRCRSQRCGAFAPSPERYSCNSRYYWNWKRHSKFVVIYMVSTRIYYVCSNMAASPLKLTIYSWEITWIAASSPLRPFAFCSLIKSSILRTSSFSEAITNVLA